MKPIHSFCVENLKVKIYPDRLAMGRAAAEAAAAKMKELLKAQKDLSVVFASAPSQNEFLEALGQDSAVDWSRMTAFHLDEYVGLPETAPQNFGHFLRVRLFEKVHLHQVHYLNGMAADLEAECLRYQTLLKDHPLDIACLGIGENGHLAFNDPPVADFDDPRSVKVVTLDPVSRQQQVHDGCFENLDRVPKKALTLTLPAILSARFIFCMVPGTTKAEAVNKTLKGPVTTACPATILRTHTDATLLLDRDSAKSLKV